MFPKRDTLKTYFRLASPRGRMQRCERKELGIEGAVSSEREREWGEKRGIRRKEAQERVRNE